MRESSLAFFGTFSKTTILVNSLLNPKTINAVFFCNLNSLYALMHSESTLTPDDFNKKCYIIRYLYTREVQADTENLANHLDWSQFPGQISYLNKFTILI